MIPTNWGKNSFHAVESQRERRSSSIFFDDKDETTITNQSSQGYHQRSISSIRVTDPLTAGLVCLLSAVQISEKYWRKSQGMSGPQWVSLFEKPDFLRSPYFKNVIFRRQNAIPRSSQTTGSSRPGTIFPSWMVLGLIHPVPWDQDKVS